MKKTQETRVYGQQLLVDGYGGNKSKLRNFKLLYKFLNDLPARIGMTRLGCPYVIYIDDKRIEGLSGFVFIMESHICFHNYLREGFISLDLFSCKEFDHKLVVKIFCETFGIKEVETHVLERGKKFPVLDNSKLGNKKHAAKKH